LVNRLKYIGPFIIVFTFCFIPSFGQDNGSNHQSKKKMENSIKVAAAQVAPVYLDKQKTIEKACGLIEEAANHGAKLIVFPEAFIPGYPDWIWLIPNSKSTELNRLYAEIVENAISIPDQSTDKLCQAAKKNGIFVVIGMSERNSEKSNSSLYNGLLFIDDQGNLMGKHRKLVPTGGERLIWAQGDGTTLETFQTSIGKMGALICWENYMPLARNALYEQGVQILITPTWDKSPNWLISLQHIAREGGLFIISTCMAWKMEDLPDRFEFKKLYPKEREWINTGNSCIVGPNGKILAGPLEAEEGILYAEIDLNDILSAKRLFDVSGHYARPDVFEYRVIKNPSN
jgi:nitrilase